MKDIEFVKWLKYGSKVVPYFEHQLMREFNIDKRTLIKWLEGKCPKQSVRDSVVEWLRDSGYKAK